MAGPGSSEHLEWLRQELVRWQHEGLISNDQALRILGTYQGQEALIVRTQTQRRIVAVLAALGAILVGLGVILFFASNWEAIPQWNRFAIILISTAGAYALGYRLRFSRGYVGVGSAVLLLGALLYGAGIFLVGQIFNVEAEPHYGLLLWAIGILPLGYLLPLNGIITLGAVVVTAWVLVVSVLGPERYGFYDALLPIRTTLAAGIALYGLGQLHIRHPATKAFGRPYLVIGALVAFSVFYTYVLSVTSLGGLAVAGRSLPGPLALLQFGTLLLAVVILLGNFVLDPDRAWGSMEAAALVILLVVPWMTPPGIRNVAAAAGDGSQRLTWLLVSNLLFFGACLGAAVLGVHRRDRALVNIGLVFFAIGVATRYIDIIGKILNTSLFFIGGGLLLLGGGWLVERTRRRLLQRMEGLDVGA